ncbi:MAG: enoyl-CoA hydratase/isomerase family protein [Rhizomicrobium sp.]|jgi:enoyl-CoA hydratase
MSDEDVLFEQRGALGLITLNRPKALNALTHAMCVRMKMQLDAWADDASVRTVAIRGEGDRAFCAGGDIRALYDSGRARTSYAFDFYRDEYRLNATIKHFPKPYIAFLRGIVMGGGVGVSVHGSHRVADETAVFAMPETGIGLFPDVGGSHFLPRCPGRIGMYLALTGARLKTADMLYAGIATQFVLADRTARVVARLSDGESPESAIGDVSAVGEAPLAELRGSIDRTFAAERVEEILARLAAPSDDWARATATTISAKSPTGSKLAFRQIREGSTMTFDECMRMEFRMVNRVIAGHDFYEGVRATIIDKDQKPQWKPAALADVSDADIDAYFAPLGGKELVL